MSSLHPVLHDRWEAAKPRRSAGIGRAVKASGRRGQRLMACALALATAWASMSAPRSPGDSLKADLRDAGAAIRDLGLNQPIGHVQKTVAALFPGANIDVDASQFPARVLVTLRALDRDTCLAASAGARRLQGRVVVELRGFASPADCGEHNDMAWLILP